MKQSKSLFSAEFVALCFICFFAFCNLSVFYGFYSYLGTIGIPVHWRGFLVGLEPMTSFVLRLAVVPLLDAGNAIKVLLASLLLVIVTLCSYLWAVTVEALVLVRILHGLAFVLLVTAGTSLLVQFIPKERSAQGFGIMSVAILSPYAVMPLVTEILLRSLGSTPLVYAAVSVLAVPAIVLLWVLHGRIDQALGSGRGPLFRRPTSRELAANLRHRSILVLLGVNFLLYLGHTTVFFFVKDFAAAGLGGDPGVFFTLSTLATIFVRLAGGVVLDRIDKVCGLRVALPLLAAFFVLLPRIGTISGFYFLAVFYGTCLGVATPLLNSALFLASPPSLRAVNTNLSLFMMDAAFFMSPYTVGVLLAGGVSYAVLYTGCAGCLLTAAGLLYLLPTGEWPEAADGAAKA
jgi:predicted MFS family arabinose efflux permease